MKYYLIQSAEKSVKKLTINSHDVSAYNNLVETIYCQVMLLNRRRPGELQRMLLQTYLSCGNTKGHYEEFESIITPIERILLTKLKRVVIRGKRGRGVPVLFSDDVQKNIQVMLEVRPNLVPNENIYLFAKANSKTEICGYKIVNKYAHASGAKNPTSITATRLRKHLATLMQIFNMTESDIEQLAAFMGHTPGIHRTSYRLPDDVFQTAKLSKLLLLMEKGEAIEYKGKSLEEIDLDLEENLMEENWENESDMEDLTHFKNTDFMYEANSNKINSSIAGVNSCQQDVDRTPQQKTKKKRILIPWTSEQKRLAKEFFSKNIKYSKAPKRQECENLIEKYAKVFENKNWLKVKVFIQNQYKGKA